MSSASQSSGTPIDLGRAAALKQQLSEFVTKGALRPRYEQHQKLFLELCESADEGDQNSILDWFLFEWLDERGEGAIDHFLRSGQITGGDSQVVKEWEDSLQSVFEIVSNRRDRIEMRDLDGGDLFEVVATTSEQGDGYQRGAFLATRLLPLGDYFVVTGPRCLLPD